MRFGCKRIWAVFLLGIVLLQGCSDLEHLHKEKHSSTTGYDIFNKELLESMTEFVFYYSDEVTISVTYKETIDKVKTLLGITEYEKCKSSKENKMFRFKIESGKHEVEASIDENCLVVNSCGYRIKDRKMLAKLFKLIDAPEIYSIHEPYSYPVEIGSVKWEQMTVEEQLDNCCIPEETLGKMDTMALAQNVVEYPFLYDFYLYSSIDESVTIMGKQWLPLKVFVDREGAYEALCKADVSKLNKRGKWAVERLKDYFERENLRLPPIKIKDE
ncbi:hypothetical protein SAMN02910358_01562 [Lachnospiraceae bacterium XBB1006]|nr:hypothetical protein SAMN02910358_01562 [Lachnospiraceae bacterium XBB1006]